MREAKINLALEKAWSDNCEKYPQLEMVIHPIKSRGIRALSDFDEGEVTFVPLTLVIGLKKEAKDIVWPNLCVGTFEDPRKAKSHIALMAAGGMKLPQDKQSGKVATGLGALKDAPSAFVSPFWFVEKAKVDYETNVSLKTASIDVLGVNVKIPIMVNTKKVACGDRFLLKNTLSTAKASEQRPAVAPAKAAGKALAGQPPLKKAKK